MKLSRALFIPAITLLPFTSSFAVSRHSHPVTAPHVSESAAQTDHTTTQSQPQTERATLRSQAAQGTMTNSSTIQINTQNLSKLHSRNHTPIISLIDKHGVKQRYVLLSPSRSHLINSLIKSHGRIKEFHFYPVTDENGENTHLLASKRIVSAPANQLTLIFKNSAEAQSFLTKEQQALTDESIYQSSQTTQQEQQQTYSQEINSISNDVEMHLNDKRKSSIIEPIHLFPMAAAIKKGNA